MNPLAIGGIVEAVGKVADGLFTSDKERLDAEIELRKLDQAIDLAQVEVNKVEAAHTSVWVSGWRPGVGWVGVAAMAYQFVLYPLMVWVWALLQANGWVPTTLAPPPMLDTEALWVILTGILGLGTARTVEKLRGKANR